MGCGQNGQNSWDVVQGVWSKFLGCVVIVPVAILEKLAPMCLSFLLPQAHSFCKFTSCMLPSLCQSSVRLWLICYC